MNLCDPCRQGLHDSCVPPCPCAMIRHVTITCRPCAYGLHSSCETAVMAIANVTGHEFPLRCACLLREHGPPPPYLPADTTVVGRPEDRFEGKGGGRR